jgi:small subunit ribosomal protein S9
MTEVKKTTTKKAASTKKADADKTKVAAHGFKGRYIEEMGKRKSASARVRLYKAGEGAIVINGKDIEEYFTPTLINLATAALKLTGQIKELNFSVVVNGGGTHGQAEAVRHGIAKTLIALDANLRPSIKAKGLLTRDARVKERKKPGLKKARKAPQWAKR